MSEEKRDEHVEEVLNTPEPAADTADWDLGSPEAEATATDLLSPAVEDQVENHEVPVEFEDAAASFPETPAVEAVETPAADAQAPAIAANAEPEAPLADIFLSKEDAVQEDIPRDVLALRTMPDPEPTRRSFDFSKLGGAETAAEEAAPEPQNAPLTEVVDATAPEALVVEEVPAPPAEVARKEIFEQAKAEAEEAVSAWKPRAEDAPVSDNTAALVLSNTSVPLVIPSRLGARLWSFFMTLLGAPVAWYLLSDGAARFTLGENSPYQTGMLNLGACVEFTAGLILAVALLIFLVRSSLGALTSGLVLMVLGTPFLVVPGFTKEFLSPAITWLKDWNDFGANLAHHLNWTGYTGAIFLAGLMLFVMGIVAILARRDGRKEAEIRGQIERYAPHGAKK
ncbi:MAG: hypothetical protein Q4D73_00095 [Actinomycetaceae bacterium]|nr:hypothetical protein [Actinomycetaceae bacterium]